MAQTSTPTLFMSLAAVMLLTSAVLVQAQTCTTRYNPLQQQYETQCTNDLSALASMMQGLTPAMPQYDPLAVRQQQLAIKQQRNYSGLAIVAQQGR